MHRELDEAGARELADLARVAEHAVLTLRGDAQVGEALGLEVLDDAVEAKRLRELGQVDEELPESGDAVEEPEGDGERTAITAACLDHAPGDRAHGDEGHVGRPMVADDDQARLFTDRPFELAPPDHDRDALHPPIEDSIREGPEIFITPNALHLGWVRTVRPRSRGAGLRAGLSARRGRAPPAPPLRPRGG